MQSNLQVNIDFIRDFIKEQMDYSSDIVHIQRLSGGVLNHIFKVQLKNDNNITNNVIKVFSPDMLDPNACASRQEIFDLQSHAFLDKAPVPQPHLYCQDHRGYEVLVMDYIEGSRELPSRSDELYALGQSIAQFHVSMQALPPLRKQPNDIKALGLEIWQSVKRGLFQTSALKEMSYLYDLSSYALSTLTYPSSKGLSTGLVHGDLHPGNVILSNGRYVMFDFELCYNGPLIKDLANAVCMFCFNDKNATKEFSFEKMSALLSGYHSLRQINDKELEHLPAFLLDRAGLERVANHKLRLLGLPPGTEFDLQSDKALNEAMSSWFDHVDTLLEFKPKIELRKASNELLYIHTRGDDTESSCKQVESPKGSAKQVRFQL